MDLFIGCDERRADLNGVAANEIRKVLRDGLAVPGSQQLGRRTIARAAG
ncbi:hypothetical protein [Rhodococcus jostii]